MIKTLTLCWCLFYFTSYRAQINWNFNLTPDFVFEIRDEFGVYNRYTVVISIWNEDYHFEKELTLKKDHWGRARFPEDFFYLEDFDKSEVADYNFEIYYKRVSVYSGKFTYDSAPNNLLQAFFVKQMPGSFKINGNILDAYQWEDKNGVNWFVRTEKTDRNNKFIYAYHFRNNGSEAELIQKHVESGDLQSTHFLTSFEITDLDRDSVAEIIFSYQIVEQNGKSLKKMILFAADKKFGLRQSHSKLNQSIVDVADQNLKSNPTFEYYMHKKWARKEE